MQNMQVHIHPPFGREETRTTFQSGSSSNRFPEPDFDITSAKQPRDVTPSPWRREHAGAGVNERRPMPGPVPFTVPARCSEMDDEREQNELWKSPGHPQMETLRHLLRLATVRLHSPHANMEANYRCLYPLAVPEDGCFEYYDDRVPALYIAKKPLDRLGLDSVRLSGLSTSPPEPSENLPTRSSEFCLHISHSSQRGKLDEETTDVLQTCGKECTVKVQATCLTEWTCATARLETGVTEIGKAPQSNYPERKIFPAALFTLTLTALAAARPLINSKRAPFTDVVPEVVDDDNGSSWSWDTSKHAGGCRLGNCYITSKSANRALNADFDRECTVGHCPHLEVPTVKAVRSTEQDWLQNSWSDSTKLMRVDKLSNEELIPAFHGFVGWKIWFLTWKFYYNFMLKEEIFENCDGELSARSRRLVPAQKFGLLGGRTSRYMTRLSKWDGKEKGWGRNVRINPLSGPVSRSFSERGLGQAKTNSEDLRADFAQSFVSPRTNFAFNTLETIIKLPGMSVTMCDE
ncbi:hypothetical protein C8J57DRAFT_1230239 [Mycena rebaudengoi]|nr:hypothetical protein C8J57DRAFT_1230239 [Mycena rebaudengoi]